MARTPINQGTITQDANEIAYASLQNEQANKTPKQKCEESGGKWDAKTQTCILLNAPGDLTTAPKEEQKPTTQDQILRNQQGNLSGITVDGKTFLGLNAEDIETITASRQAKVQGGPATQAFEQQAIAQQQQRDQLIQGQQLAGQVGQVNDLGLSQDPLVSLQEASTQGIVASIPSAVRTAGTFAAGGLALGAFAKGGAIAGTTISPGLGTAIGAGVGLVAGIVAGMISNIKGQRSDTITAQKRTLDEGKQTMKDWATLAEGDPANRAYYLSQYNLVSAQIAQAYRQMKYDTQRDLLKFDTAIPDLAEFEAFYARGGEKESLDIEMRQALLTASPNEYKMLDLINRRGEVTNL